MARPRRSATQPRQAERQQIAALRRHQRMQFVEHHALQRAEQITARRRWRAAAPAAPASSAGCRADRGAGAGASRSACRRCGFRCGSAGPFRATGFPGCARCRPPAPSAARCRACAGLRSAALAAGRIAIRRGLVPRSLELHQRRQKARQRLAAAGRRDQQHRAAVARLAPAIRADARAAPSRARKPARKHVRQQRRGFDLFGEDVPRQCYPVCLCAT